MSKVYDLLIELGTEDLPPKSLTKLTQSLAAGIRQGLEKVQLHFGAIRTYATPRRMAVVVDDLQTRQQNTLVERRGPALTSAFDEDGNATSAAQGFARSCGVKVDDLEKLETTKGAWLVFKQRQLGRETAEMIPELLQQAIHALPIAKRMRWGSIVGEFVRPVHWLVLLFGDDVIPFEFLGVTSCRDSQGHRFHHPGTICVHSPQTYVSQLATEGYVLADMAVRRDTIRNQVSQLATELGGQVVMSEALLDEVTGMVEWPVALSGSYDKRFLALPIEVLICSMEIHQKYFAVSDEYGHLLPHFITVCNINSHDQDQVVAGNERVILPRLSDAEFFWQQDRRHPLADRRQQLKTIVFHNKLGSVFDKSARIVKLVAIIAKEVGADIKLAERAAWLAKCDLVTEIVSEFPDLQGIMGHHYAQADGEQMEVAQALDEQYLPRFSGDKLPQTKTGQVLGLADKLETLVGLFGIGEPPTAVKDPFALRRAALGILRIIIECKLDIDLLVLVQKTRQIFAGLIIEHDATEQDQVMIYLFDRLRTYALDQGVAADVFAAVLAVHPMRPLDFVQRLQAVTAFVQLEQAQALVTINKRISNILNKNNITINTNDIVRSLLREQAEQKLADQLAKVADTIKPLMAKQNYTSVLVALAGMQDVVDNFFVNVMVMVDDDAIRQNRLNLLNRTHALFLSVADISLLRE